MTNESTRSERLSVGSRAEPLPLTNAAPASTLMRGSFRAGHSAAWSARLPWAQEVAGSNPAVPTISLRRRAATRTRRPVRPVTRARCPVRPATAAAANCRRSGAATWNRRPSSAAAGTGVRRAPPLEPASVERRRWNRRPSNDAAGRVSAAGADAGRAVWPVARRRPDPFSLLCARSSTGQSTGLLSRGLQVRALPGAPILSMGYVDSLKIENRPCHTGVTVR